MDKQVFKNNKNTIENIDLENKATYLWSEWVPGSILIDVDNLKVVVDLINTMIFCLMTRTLILTHFWWEGKEGGVYGSQSLWMVEDKNYGNPNP